MTKTADAYLAEHEERKQNGVNLNHQHEAYIQYRNSLIVLQDRIFIARDLKKKTMFRLWGDTIGDFTKDGNGDKFVARLNAVEDIIIDIAAKD